MSAKVLRQKDQWLSGHWRLEERDDKETSGGEDCDLFIVVMTV